MKKSENLIMVILYAAIIVLIIGVLLSKIHIRQENKSDVPEEAGYDVFLSTASTDEDFNSVVGLKKVLDTHKDLTYKFYAEFSQNLDAYLKQKGYEGQTANVVSVSDEGTNIIVILAISETDERICATYEQGTENFSFSVD